MDMMGAGAGQTWRTLRSNRRHAAEYQLTAKREYEAEMPYPILKPAP